MTHNVAPKECFFSTAPLVNSIEKICSKLFDESGISHFGFSRVFDEGSWIDYTTSPEWTNYFYQNDLHKTSISGRLQEGVNYLKKSSKNEITHLQELSAKHFDLCNTLDFINRGNGCFDVFTFSTSKKNYDKVLRFYTHHQDKLLKFSAYFNKEAQGIIAEGYSHKIDLPNYQTPESKLTRFFDKEITETGHELSFTAKEFIVLILYASGCSAKQIAGMLYKSENTIETHLYNIRKKTGHADRLSLKKYVIDQGWEGLEKFFFPYIHNEVST